MQNYEDERDFETKRLAQVIAIAQQQLDAIRISGGQQAASLVEAKKDLWENSSHSVSNLWSSDGFYELAALGQYAAQVSNKISALELAEEKLLALERMVQSPYFARVDFRFTGEDSCEKVYIGRASLLDESKMCCHVYDWRSPLASVFYRFGVGEAYYDAPKGRVFGQVELKRQFEIQCCELEYFFDADVQIMDEFLKKLLAQNSSPQMKTIVETIQKDQDIIIRDMENDLLMVQGVAGSGKTSVALHRVAYLMYQGLTEKLSAHNIMVISPNSLFERYIANVLPELGEDNVVTVTFERMIEDVLSGARPQSRNQLLESVFTGADMGVGREENNLRLQALEFKGSMLFRDLLERFIADIPRLWLDFSDVEYDGECLFSGVELRDKILSATSEPLQVRLLKLEKAIWEQVHARRPARMEKLRALAAEDGAHIFEGEEYARMLSIRECTALREKIRAFTRLDAEELYRRLFSDWEYFWRLAQGLPLVIDEEDVQRIWRLSCENLESEQLSYEDGLAVAFLSLRLNGFYQARHIKQVVIDEAQDYYPLHFAILRLLFPEARYTILGDIRQTVEKTADISLFESLAGILGKEKSTLVTMRKGFRCTREILDFSKKFLPPGTEIESFSRQGDPPQIHVAPTQEALDELLLAEIGFCQQAGYQSVGLLCKTESDAIALYERLRGRVALRLIHADSATDIKGVAMLPVYMAKGLEFDAVLLTSVEDKNLLYIGCTRALHRLNLFYVGKEASI